MLLKKILLILILLSFWKTAHPTEITFLTHGSKESTYIDRNGELRGLEHAGRRAFNVELVREMMDLVNHPKKIANYPFVRAFKMVRNLPDHALFNVNRSPEREETVKWVGPLQSSTTHFYESKRAPTGIKKLNDARRVDSICVLNGNIHHTKLKKLGFANLHLNTSYEGCYRMLVENRVDLTPISNISTATRKNSEFYPHIQQTSVILSKRRGYLAFSKNINDRDIQQWQDAIDYLKQSGRYDQLVEKYLLD